jgi:hypothetical protein
MRYTRDSNPTLICSCHVADIACARTTIVDNDNLYYRLLLSHNAQTVIRSIY